MGFFDPLGFSYNKDDKTMDLYREMEVRCHCSVYPFGWET